MLTNEREVKEGCLWVLEAIESRLEGLKVSTLRLLMGKKVL